MTRLLLALLLLALAAEAGDIPVERLPREARGALEMRIPGPRSERRSSSTSRIFRSPRNHIRRMPSPGRRRS